MAEQNGDASSKELWRPHQAEIKLTEAAARSWTIVGRAEDLTIEAIMAPDFLSRRIEDQVGNGIGGIRPGDQVYVRDTQLRAIWGHFLVASCNYAGRTAVMVPITPVLDLSGVERAAIDPGKVVVEPSPNGWRAVSGLHHVLRDGFGSKREGDDWVAREQYA